MKIQEIRTKPDVELEQELAQARLEAVKLRIRIATRQLNNPTELRKARKKIARILTVLRERKAAGA
ncbi:MAG: 50S ribosomal protein L29 [Chloroflexi bacterium]|nr:50S ribosomal protein L29 [Chloroflexota bacterium]